MLKTTDSKILVVEDDPGMCRSMRFLLSSYGFDIQTSQNLPDAFNSLQTNAYGLILLDLNIEDQSGFAVMDHLAKSRLDTPVIIVTGERSEEKAITALKKGAVDYLKKPFDPDALLESIQSALNRRKRQRNKNWLTPIILSSRERYRTIVDSQKDYICRIDTNFFVTFVNRAYADYWQSSPKRLIGQPFVKFIRKSIYQHLIRNLKHIRSGTKMLNIKFKAVGTENSQRWLQWKFQGILDQRGDLSEIQCVGRDVTRRKLQTEATEKKKEKYRQLAEMTSDWIWEVDSNGFYTYASPVVSELLGYSPEEVIGKRPFDFMPAKEAQRLQGIFQKAVADGKRIRNLANINRHKNGKYVIVETSGVPIHDAGGAVIGYRGVDRNISARKLAELRLNEKTIKLKQALNKVKRLSGLLPICSSCKKIRDDKGYWNQIESYVRDHSEAEFSHGICPDCAKTLYPDVDLY